VTIQRNDERAVFGREAEEKIRSREEVRRSWLLPTYGKRSKLKGVSHL